MSLLKTYRDESMDSESFLSQKMRKQIEWILLIFLLLGYTLATFAQNGLNDLNYQAQSEFQPTIKDAVKFSDIPEIKDSVKRIENIKYGINSSPIFAKYEVKTIEAAKLQNEPLSKLYHSLLKVGYGPLYNMPYGEFWIANTRAKESSYGAHLNHFSSNTQLDGYGKGNFSDNAASVFGKKFYKKHTLSGDFDYLRNVTHYYGYADTLLTADQQQNTKQRYQLIQPKVQLRSHYTDSTHINHNIQLGYYNLSSLYNESENNIKLNALGEMFVNKEKLNVGFLVDYYNHKQANDTLNDLIISLNPSFEANGKKWHADLGVTATIDNFGNTSKFYFYPQINLHYDIYENLVIPYAGATGGLQKNSMRSLTTENPFVDTTLNYRNTNNKYNLFGGLKGNLSSSTSYDAMLKYSQYGNMHFYVIDYSSPNQLYNQFNVIYDDASLITISGQLKYQAREKLTMIAKGDYYIYQTKTITRAYSKPDFDLTASAIYNLDSKIIIRADLFFMGKQWAYTQGYENNVPVLKPKQINGWADLNLEAEYRYSKMLSFFTRINNIANQRYYRWERYPSQRFNFMIGLTFVPF
jgi:hypothetical protein